jgi:hypothetical protein
MHQYRKLDWTTHDDPPIHVYPTYGRAHEVDGLPCWCCPRTEQVPRTDGTAGLLIIHAEEN